MDIKAPDLDTLKQIADEQSKAAIRLRLVEFMSYNLPRTETNYYNDIDFARGIIVGARILESYIYEKDNT